MVLHTFPVMEKVRKKRRGVSLHLLSRLHQCLLAGAIGGEDAEGKKGVGEGAIIK